MQEKNIETLVINKVENQEVYDAMVAANKINNNELYLVGGGESVFTEDGNGNIVVNNADEQKAKQFLQSLTFPGLNYKYVNPFHSATYGNPYGAYIKSGTTIIDYVVNTITEPGVYTAYVNRAVEDIPEAAKTLNSSLRGFISVSQLNKSSTVKCYAFILLMDEASNFYVQYIKGNVGSGWKQMQDKISATGLLKSDGDGNITAAVAGVDYVEKVEVATIDTSGLMSASDKIKLNGISEGANKTTVDDALKSDSTNPVQNKVINTKLTTMQTNIDSKVDKDGNKVLSTNDFTTELKNNLNSAYTHSTSAHAPSNAERNTIVTIKKNGTALSPDSSRAINITVPTKVSELTNDSGYLTSVPVTSVNSKTGAVSLTASDVGAAPSSHTHNYAGSSSAGGAATSANKVNKSMTVKLNGGTTEGTNQFTFDGSSAKNVNITPSGIGAAAANHTHDYLPLTGGSLTGNLVVGNAGVQANGYVVSTWLQTTQTSDKAGNFATIDGDGWIYYRTPAETLADIGAASASHNHSASNITSGTISIARGGTGGATASAALSNLGAVPKSGGTMTGPLVAQTNTSYTTAQMRNVIISTADPSGGNNGDIWLKYEA